MLGMRAFCKWAFALLCAFTVLSAHARPSIDDSLLDYDSAAGVSGNLSSVGSDTLANLMTLWAEEFKHFYPNVVVQIQAAGSSTAPPALTQGTANIGPMSRKMKDREIEAFESSHGYKPMAIPVAIDALAVYVHRDNPIRGLSIEDIDAVFSSTRRCGLGASYEVWGDLGLSGDWARKDIQLFGRNSVSGTYGHFKKRALCRGDFKNTVNEQPGSASVVQSVSTSVNAIGYSGIGYKTASVKAIPLSARPGGEFIEANADNALKGSYPLSRFLYIYLNKQPNKPLAPLEREFMRFVLSKLGQQVVVKDGYVPLPNRVAIHYLTRLGIQQSE